MMALYPLLPTALLEGECLAPAISQMRVRVYEETFPNCVIEGIYTQSDQRTHYYGEIIYDC